MWLSSNISNINEKVYVMIYASNKSNNLFYPDLTVYSVRADMNKFLDILLKVFSKSS